jgi:dual specificity MAP kinase phosphatase
MAYLMKYRHMGLMDAYLVTRARRLNVLIQPNLRFFHELFGWEVELARAEAEQRERRRREAQLQGVRDPTALALLDQETPVRRILYSWPTFCRDVVSEKCASCCHGQDARTRARRLWWLPADKSLSTA